MNHTTRKIQKLGLTQLAPLQALGLVLLIILTEYIARRVIAPALPTLGAWRVNDMLVSAICYALLVLLTIPTNKRNLASFLQALREIASQTRSQTVWIGTSLLVGVGWLAVIDHWLWGNIFFPVWNAPTNPLTLFPQLGPLLRIISLLLVNGLMIPLFEERLWRGLIQPRIVSWLSFPAGLTLTALCFSLKHALVDASLGRASALFAFGLIAGFLASRQSWKASALAHSTANTIATIIALITTGGDI